MAIDMTTALSRLLTDAALRRGFRLAPLGTAVALDVQEDQRTNLARLDPDQLDRQAETLLKKRFHEIVAIIPETVAGLGEFAYERFLPYGTSTWPTGHMRHVQDAAGFCRYLLCQRCSRVCRAEINRVLFAVGRRRFSLHWTRDIRINGRRRHAAQILYRRGSKPRQLALYLG